jgi:hypothetical protein
VNNKLKEAELVERLILLCGNYRFHNVLTTAYRWFLP